MSSTTDITLCLGILDDGALHAFNQVLENAEIGFCNDAPRLQSLARAIEDLPGSKYYTNLVAAACWNNHHRMLPTLVAVFQAFPWDAPEDAILIVASEQADTEVHRPALYRGAP